MNARGKHGARARPGRGAEDRPGRGAEARPQGPAGEIGGRSLLLLFAAAFLLRLTHVLAMRASPYFTNPVIDAATYDEAARSIAAGHGHPDPIFWQPPGYSYFLSWVYRFAGAGYLAPRIAQALLGAASATMTAWIGARFFGRRVGLIAGCGAALYGMLIYYDGELLTPSLTIALQLASIVLALRARVDPRRAAWFWGGSGLLVGLASVVTAPSLVIGAVLAAAARRRAWAVLLGVVLAIAPVTARNLQRGGELIPISWNGGINLYIGNNPRYDETVAIRPDDHWKRFVLEPRRAGIRGAGAASDYFAGKVLLYAASDPAGFAALQIKKLYLLLAGNEIPRNQEIYPARTYSPVLRVLLWKIPGLAFPFGLLMPLGIVGLVVGAKRAPMLAAALITYAVSILVFFITARYRAPLVPFLLIFAAEGVRWFLADARPVGRAVWVAGALSLFLLGNLAQGPMPNTMNADAEYSLGAKLAMKGRPGEAAELFESALRKNPRYAEAWVNLGVLQATGGRAAEAERSLRRAVALDPENTIALTNLAILREKAGAREEALALYERALQIEPRDEFARRKVAELKPGS
ncbi:MAG TPA: tetratricopeptide repeat protein [Candidatus Eisenbacteria bacterium]